MGRREGPRAELHGEGALELHPALSDPEAARRVALAVQLALDGAVGHAVRGVGRGEEEAAAPEDLVSVGAGEDAVQLGRRVLVEVGRPEGLLGDVPPLREGDEVGRVLARVIQRRAQDREERRVGVVAVDGAHGHEHLEVVAVGRQVAVPRDDVEGAAFALGVMEGAAVLGDDLEGRVVLLEGGDGRLEVTGVGHGVGADHAALGELEVARVDLEDVAARRTLHVDGEGDGAGQDGQLAGREREVAELGADVERAGVRQQQEVSVVVDERAALHRAGGRVLVGREAAPRGRIARAAVGRHAVHEVVLGLDGARPPAAQGDLGARLEVAEVPGGVGVGAPRADAGGRADAVGPDALVLRARHGEGRAVDLLGVEAVLRRPRVVAIMRERAVERLGLVHGSEPADHSPSSSFSSSRPKGSGALSASLPRTKSKRSRVRQ